MASSRTQYLFALSWGDGTQEYYVITADDDDDDDDYDKSITRDNLDIATDDFRER